MPVLLIFMIPATALCVLWLVLLSQVTEEDWVAAAFCRVLDNRETVEKLKRKDAAHQESLETYQGLPARVMGLVYGGGSDKEIRKLEEQSQALQQGDLRSVSLFAMPGYVLQRRVPSIGMGSFHKTLLEKCRELYGRKYAANKTRQLMAQMLSYPIIGLSVILALGALMLALGKKTEGIAVLGVGTLLVLVLVYAIYDEVGDRLNKRRAAISRQFPNVVSKLALLVTSGMIMDRAWRETAQSQNGELYMEMRKTAEELNNLVEPSAAYAGFIDRCNTKETTKLASAMIQNQSKGNAEVGQLLKAMAHEAWQERRHTAKRDSEAANSKLMIPTMLLFLAILVMIMVPVVTSFQGL